MGDFPSGNPQSAVWLRGLDLNQRLQGYEPCELPAALPRVNSQEDRASNLRFNSLPNQTKNLGMKVIVRNTAFDCR
jgi:hypothetical protein